MSPTKIRLYAFGRFTLSETDRELMYENRKIDLQDRDLDVLLFLVERPRQLVRGDELLLGVWGEESSASVRNINHHVAKVRTALDCDPKYPTFIETVRGKGYRWIADVKVIEDDHSPPIGQTGDRREEYLITSHLFVPMYLGADTFDAMVGEIRESQWMQYKEIQTYDGRLCLSANGFGVWHLTKTMRFKSLSVIARWRKQTYEQILDGRHRIKSFTDKSPSDQKADSAFRSKLRVPGYVLSTLVLHEPRWSNSARIRNALQLLAGLTPLESNVQLRKDEEAALESRILSDGVANTELHEFGMRGADLGFACWDGVSYFNLDERLSGVVGDLVEFEIAVQATWWFAKCLSDEMAESGKAIKSKLEPFVEKLRQAFAKLESIGPLETPSQRTMCEAILSTSRVERLVNETLRQFERM